MGENDDHSAEEADDDQDDDTGADDQKADDGKGEGADDDAAKDEGDGADKGDDDKSDDDADGDKGKDDADKSKKDDDDAGDPPVRKSGNKFAAARIAKRESSKADKADAGSDGEDDDDDEGKDDDKKKSDPDDIDARIQRGIEAALHPIISEQENKDTEQQVQKYLASEEGSWFPKEKADQLVKWAQHPSRREIPIEEIALGLAGRKTLIKLGAIKERQATVKAKQSQGGGNQGGDTPAEKKIADMTPAEFKAYHDKHARQ